MPPPKESKPVETVVEEVDGKLKANQPDVESEGDSGDDAPTTETIPGAASSSKKKKKSKRKKAKDLLTGKSSDPEADIQKAIGNLTPQQLRDLMALNPGLAHEVAAASGSANPTADQAADLFKKMSLQEIMTGLAAGGKNVKDMGAYKFWQTQPVPKFGDDEKVAEGPIRVQTVDQVSTEPAALVEGFEWVTVDLTDDEEIKEVYELLNGHYVEDDEAMFRFNYSSSFLRW